MQKRIMLLGGNHTQMTCTLAAKNEGYYVISVDYLPENPAHKFADEYHNVSTIDKEAVLKLAKELKIDGIVSYASDVSAPTAAYVAEAMGLPTNPYSSVDIMTHKDKFRAFLKENGFPMPKGEGFSQNEYDRACDFFESIKKPAMIKPVDSSGSKGVNKVYTFEDFETAWNEALGYSISKNVIVEEYIERQEYQIDGDIFVIDGKIRFWGICDQHHDKTCSMYTPSGLSFPPTQDTNIQERAKEQLHRLFSLLGMHMGAYNVEYIVDKEGEVYLLEIGPRNGGNLITDTIDAATGINLARYTVRQAVGDDVSDLKQTEAARCASSYILHSLNDGIFKEIIIDPLVEKRIVKKQIYVNPGDEIKRFKNAGQGIGAMVIVFEDTKQMCEMIDNMNDYIKVIVD